MGMVMFRDIALQALVHSSVIAITCFGRLHICDKTVVH